MKAAPGYFHGMLDSGSQALNEYNRDDFEDVPEVQRYFRFHQLTGVEGFRFLTHFHPFAAELIGRLINPPYPQRPGVRALQDSDTARKTNSDGTWQVIDDSTLVELPAGSSVRFASGAMLMDGDIAVEIRATERATLTFPALASIPDATPFTIDGSTVMAPGDYVPSSRAMQFDSGTGMVPVAYGADVGIPLLTRITLRSGASLRYSELVGVLQSDVDVRVEARVVARFLSAIPEPDLYTGPLISPSAVIYSAGPLALRPYPLADIDFSATGAYSVYNWELFYHVPLTVAIHLSRTQRFEDAQRWFHFVFDPTDASPGPAPERFWKVLPFQITDARRVEQILLNLSIGADPALSTGADRALFRDTIASIEEWKDLPFRPHVVARWRQTPYMYKAVMAYLDNLIAWGDSLFRQDTRETINEAMQLYVLAANLLGARPQAVPNKGSVHGRSYSDLAASGAGLDAFSNALVALETDIPFDIAPTPTDDTLAAATPTNLGQLTLYFCVPPNEKLLGYWDTVADRLFKIHNSLNIKGIFRQLALFEPPIDPALLAKGVAAGLDIGSVAAGLSQPLPFVRFSLIVQRATEICQEVKALGAALLNAIEKDDNEALSILRARHESTILGLTEMVRYAQLQEATKSREALERSLYTAQQRYRYFSKLIGAQDADIDASLPTWTALDAAQLERLKLSSREPAVAEREIDIDISDDSTRVSEGEMKSLSRHETRELQKLGVAQKWQDYANILDATAGVVRLFPEFGIEGLPWGVGGDSKLGGQDVADFIQIGSGIARGKAGLHNHHAGRHARLGGHARREQEWTFQANSAANEISQVAKQLRAAEIREAMAKREWDNHKKQIENSRQIEAFLTSERTGKTSNQAFYAWMRREVKGLYGQCFQFAFDVAKLAEKALQHETGDHTLSFIQFGYLAGRQGLLAGERLAFDVKRMEMRYHELNEREYEITKHVSLMQLDPGALLRLKHGGTCEVQLSEEVFDIDCPGHYFRRIKAVAVTIPSVVGPYTTINCTLTLLNNDIRVSPAIADGYARGDDDPRFRPSFVGVQAIVTSSGQNDSGLFETNLRDERYLPFEGAGVISHWRFELPQEFQQFDYQSITDVVIHIRYTAREGGARLRKAATDNVRTMIEEATAAGMVRLFSLRHDFATEWAQFKGAWQTVRETAAATPPWPKLSFKITPQHYPFWAGDLVGAVGEAVLIARTSLSDLVVMRRADIDPSNPPGTEESDPVTFEPMPATTGLRSATLQTGIIGSPAGEFDLYFSDDDIEDLWLALRWEAE